jgi:HK97 family phage major capsid protein
MTPYKMAVIELFSNEFRRDLPALYGELERRLPLSLGKKLDETVFNGSAPGTNFDVLSGSASVALDLADAYGSLVGVYETLATADASLTGWAMSPQGKAILLGAVDGTKRPLFVPNVNDTNAIGRILGAPVTETKSVYAQGTPNTVGFAGDWEQARYGIVDGINIAISDEATINDGEQQINLWQRNMFAIRVEAEFGFVVKDPAAFVKITAAGE